MPECAVTDCPVPEECDGAACQPLPGAPTGCPTLPDCDASGDGHCHQHCVEDDAYIDLPDRSAVCDWCTEDAAYADEAAREREETYRGEF